LKQTGDKEKLGSRRKPSEIVYYFPVHEKNFLTYYFFNVEFGNTVCIARLLTQTVDPNQTF